MLTNACSERNKEKKRTVTDRAKKIGRKIIVDTYRCKNYGFPERIVVVGIKKEIVEQKGGAKGGKETK